MSHQWNTETESEVRRGFCFVQILEMDALYSGWIDAVFHRSILWMIPNKDYRSMEMLQVAMSLQRSLKIRRISFSFAWKKIARRADFGEAIALQLLRGKCHGHLFTCKRLFMVTFLFMEQPEVCLGCFDSLARKTTRVEVLKYSLIILAYE